MDNSLHLSFVLIFLNQSSNHPLRVLISSSFFILEYPSIPFSTAIFLNSVTVNSSKSLNSSTTSYSEERESLSANSPSTSHIKPVFLRSEERRVGKECS